jgi:hypothetical protein
MVLLHYNLFQHILPDISVKYAFVYGSYIIIIIIIIISGTAAQRGLWPPRSRGFLLTHNDAPQSVGLL